MDETEYLKCPCKECGNHIEYPPEAARTTITCPHCGQWTELEGPEEKPERVSVNLGWVVIVGAVVLVVAVVAIGWHFATTTYTLAPMAKVVPKAAGQPANLSAVVVTQAVVATPPKPKVKSHEDLKISAVTLEKGQGSLVYAVGTVTNDSAFQRFSVKVELDLINLKGKTIGKTQDQKDILEPHQEWNFRALIPETDTVAAKVSSLTEGE